MAVKLGTSSVTLKLGTQSVTGYLGSAIVTATVPGAPTITFAGLADVWIVVYVPPDSDGGSEITAYRVYLDGILTEPSDADFGVNAEFPFSLSGITVEVSAVNAIGEGPKSAPVTVA